MVGPEVSEIEKPLPDDRPSAGMRAFADLQTGPAYLDIWKRHFGAGLDLRTIRGASTLSPLVFHRERRVLELGTRFDFIPHDRQFILTPRRRVWPLRQVSPPISLEAGNMRGGYEFSGPEDQAPADLLGALSATRGWDYGFFPVPLDQAPNWASGARKAGLIPLLRQTGRVFFTTPDFRGWDQVVEGASRNFRKNIKRMERGIAESGVALRFYEGDSLDEGFARLRSCAEDSWKAGDDLGGVPVVVPLTERQLQFFRDLEGAGGRSILIATMEHEGRTLAVQLWVRGAGQMLGGVMYHRPESRPYAPGHALMKFTLSRAGDEGVRRIDFNATDPWLAAYASHATEFGMLLVTRDTGWGRLVNRIARRFDPGLPLEG